MVKILKPSLSNLRLNRELFLGSVVIFCLGIILICSLAISLLTVKVSYITPTEDYHYYVKVKNQVFDLVPSDVLRIERTPAKTFTGKTVELLKVYTNYGFIYSVPSDEFYTGVKQLAGAADWYSEETWMRDGTELTDIRKKGYAIGTPKGNTLILFAVLGLQNLSLIAAGLALIMLIFPLRFDKDSETATVVSRVEQPA